MIESKELKNTLVRFFDKSETSNPQVKAVADIILKKEKEKNFIKDFVKYGGYPLWNQSMVTSFRNTIQSTLARSGNEFETSILIPFALENDSTVNAILQVRMNPTDTSFVMLYNWQYNINGYTKDELKNNADEYALLFMAMESKAFGHTNFKVLDSGLFKTDYDHLKNKYIRITSSTNNVISRGYFISITTCYVVQVSDDEGQVVGCPPGANCNTYHTEEQCTTKSYYFPEYPQGGGGNIGGPDDPNGGAGGGGSPNNGNGAPNGDWTDNPCPPFQSCEEFPGWQGLPPVDGQEYILTKLTQDLGLDHFQFNWLVSYPARALEIAFYLETHSIASEKEICFQHINRMMNEPAYLGFVELHDVTGDPYKMWWEDVAWLGPYGGGPDYGNWAINYLVQNTSTSFSLFQNQFMSMPEGSDGGDVFNLADYDNVQVPTFTKLPGRNDLYNAFPKAGTVGMESKDVYELVGENMYIQNIADNQNYRNACAIRVSRALNYSSYNNTFHVIPVFKNKDGDQKSEKGKDGKNYILDAASLLAYMLKAYPNNPPLHLKNKQPEEYLKALNGKWGIYIMIPKPNSNFNASGHADFFSQNNCLTKSCYFQSAQEIYFWELF